MALVRQTLQKLLHKGVARLKLRHRDIFIGLMGLIDIARPANNGGISAFLELACLGAIADFVAGIIARHGAHQRLGLALGFGAQARHVETALGQDVGIGVDGLHLRLDRAHLL